MIASFFIMTVKIKTHKNSISLILVGFNLKYEL